MLKILQDRLQQYFNLELPDVQAGFRKGRGTGDQIANIRWTREKAREFQKNIYSCFIDYAKAFHYADHNKLWKILKDTGIPDYLTLLRNLCVGQKETVETCILSYVKRIASPGSVHDTGCSGGWCTGMTQRDGMGREVRGGFRMGNTCTPMADSCQCMAKPIQYCKVKINK